MVKKNGKCKFGSKDTDTNSSGNSDNLDDMSSSSDSNLNCNSSSSLESNSSDENSLEDECISTAGMEEASIAEGASSYAKSVEDSDKKWTTIHKQNVQGMLNETADFRNLYDIRKHLWSRQGGLRFTFFIPSWC